MSVSDFDGILESARELWARQDDLTHDLVDGEFYWRHCRWEAVQGLLDIIHEHTVDDDGERSSLPVDVYNRIGCQMDLLQAENPAIDDWFSYNPAPRMRDAITAWRGATPTLPMFELGQGKQAGSGTWLMIGVRNSRWTGPDVERFGIEHVERTGRADHNRRWIEELHEKASDTQAFVGMDFTFYAPNQLRLRSDWGRIDPDVGLSTQWIPVESPVIMCAIPFPLPPSGVIAHIYDAVARRQHAWHERLYGYGASEQEIATSIRTWTIGLLVGRGRRFDDARRLVEDLLGTGISQPGFQQDRNRLLQRVPEAKPYLYQRPRTTT